MSILDTLRKGNHVCRLQGKEFVLLSGLLTLAHENGLESLDATMIEHDPGEKVAVFRCLASGSRGSFSGHGDASPDNLSRNMVPSYIRMAETRSIARSLRFYLGIGMCARDELPGNMGNQEPEPQKPPPPPPKETGPPVHHSSWEDDRKGFCASVGEFGGYDAVAAWAESNSYGRPSHWSTKKRSVLLDKIKSGEIQIIPF